MKYLIKAAIFLIVFVATSTTTHAGERKTCDGSGYKYHIEDEVFGITTSASRAHRIIKRNAGRPARTNKIEMFKSLKHGHSWFHIYIWLIAPPKEFKNIKSLEVYHEKFEFHTKSAKVTGKINSWILPKSEERPVMTLRITASIDDLAEILRDLNSDTESFDSDTWLILRRFYRFRINQRILARLMNRTKNVTYDQVTKIRNGNCDGSFD